MPPDYPPAQQAWRFPPPAVPKRWRWVALAAPLVAIAVVVGVLYGVYRSNDLDARGFIDDPDVSSAVSAACTVMTSTVEGLRAEGTALRQARVLADQNAAIDIMVREIKKLPAADRAADRPVNAWLADWERLAAAREELAQQVRSGDRPSFTIPEDDSGKPIVDRMNRAANGVCTVPETLIDPFGFDDLAV